MNWIERNAKWFFAAGTLAVLSVALCLVTRPAPPVQPTERPPPDPPAERAMGWIENPEEVAEVVATCRFPVFADTPAGQAADVPDQVFQWEITKAALGGDGIPARNQLSVGSCPSFGGIGPVEYQECVRMVAAKKAGQPPPPFRELSQEVLYSFARVKVLKGQVRGDGATGASAAQATRDFGVCPRGKYASVDLSTYSEATCRKFGDVLPPTDVIAEAAKHKVGSISPVKTTEELRKGMASGYTASVASGVGFGPTGGNVRDKDGCLIASGKWNHAMFFIGYTKHPTRGWLYCVMNSWGPKWVSGPNPLGSPDGSFWVDDKTAQRMLDAKDSWFYDGVGGFEARKPLDWTARPVQRIEAFALSNPFGGSQCELHYSLSP